MTNANRKLASFFTHLVTRRSPLFLSALYLLCVASSFAQTTRPKITSIAAVRLYSADLHASRAFFSKTLGLGSTTATCLGMTNPCYVVNGHQRVELQQIAGGAPDNLLAEIAFSTPDVAAMRNYLLAHKIEAGPITKDETGALRFSLRDPEGNPLAFIQQTGDRFFSPAPHQISTRIFHAGFIVKDLSKQVAFYEGILGFRLYWKGGFKDDGLDWYEIQVPEGQEWIEFMLNIPANADRQERGVQNHFSLGVKDANVAAKVLRANGATKFDGPEVGRDGKNSLDIYDPDLSRVEVMDPVPTGKICCNPYTAPHPKL